MVSTIDGGTSTTSISAAGSISSTTTTTTTTAMVGACNECMNVKNEVNSVREKLHFLTHQIALLMRFLSVGCCRCASCDAYLLANNGGVGGGSGDGGSTISSTSGGSTIIRNSDAATAAAVWADVQQQTGNGNGYDQYLHSSYTQLLAALRHHQQTTTQQDCHFSPRVDSNGEGVAATNESSTTTSASARSSVDEKRELASAKIGKKRPANIMNTRCTPNQIVAEAEEEEENENEYDDDDDEGCDYPHAPKRRIVGVDELLPKLFAVVEEEHGKNGGPMAAAACCRSQAERDAEKEPEAEVIGDDRDGSTMEDRSTGGCSAETTRRSSEKSAAVTTIKSNGPAAADDSDLAPASAIFEGNHTAAAMLSAMGRAYSLGDEEKTEKMSPPFVVDHHHHNQRSDRDFMTPPAVLGEPTPKERFLMNFIHRPHPILYPFMPYAGGGGGMAAAGGKSDLTSPMSMVGGGGGCCSPPLRQISRLDCFKAICGTAAVVERPRSLHDESPCSSNGGGGSAELPKTCVDMLGRSGLESMYPPSSGLILTPGQVLPTTTITNGSSYLNRANEQQLNGFPPTGPPLSIGLPLVTQGPRMSTFYCTICNRDFSNVYYKRHMIVHANARPYICDVCGKRFNERSNMMKHKQRLHGP